MTAIEFQVQINRVTDTWGEKSYPKPRMDEIWGVLKNESPGIAGRAITWLIQTQRAAPMIPDFLKALEHIKGQEKQFRREYDAGKFGTTLEALQDAAKQNKTADPDFVAACLKNLELYQSGKISFKQFNKNCDELDAVANRLNPSGAKKPYGYEKREG